MAQIQIIYYGHSCFKVQYEGHSVVFDPYADDSVPGLKLPAHIQCDAVYCSHDHSDHNAADLIETNGTSPFPFFCLSIPHDDVQGTKRGFSNITLMKVGSVTVTHMGDIGRVPTAEEYEALERTDVLLMPVGGFYTVDTALAAQIIHHIGAKCTIVMHYRKGAAGYDVLNDLDHVKKVLPSLKECSSSTISFDESKVPEEIISLAPMQTGSDH